MTKEEMIELAKQAGWQYAHGESGYEALWAFGKLVAEKEYERGFIDGMQKQMQSSVDKAVNAMGKREWAGLTEDEMNTALDYWSDDSRSAYGGAHSASGEYVDMIETWRYIEAKLKEKNT